LKDATIDGRATVDDSILNLDVAVEEARTQSNAAIDRAETDFAALKEAT
jgi:hypothetical protein